MKPKRLARSLPGADAPSGLYVKLAGTDETIAQSNRGDDTDVMFEVTLSLAGRGARTIDRTSALPL